jgi:hypothetical protein
LQGCQNYYVSVRANIASGIRFFATLGEEPEVEVALL